MAASYMVCLDELLHSHVRCTRRCHHDHLRSQVCTVASTHSGTTKDSRYAQKTLKVLEKLSQRGTIWPGSCAKAVERLVTALNQRKEAAVPALNSTNMEPPLTSSAYSQTSDRNLRDRRSTRAHIYGQTPFSGEDPNAVRRPMGENSLRDTFNDQSRTQ
jgi:hypothetical protein